MGISAGHHSLPKAPLHPSATHLDSSCVPRLTKVTLSTEASWPSNVCEWREGV